MIQREFLLYLEENKANFNTAKSSTLVKDKAISNKKILNVY